MVQLKAMKREPATLLLYRWRYIIGYTFLAGLFLLSVTMVSLYSPGGLLQSEINALRNTNLLADGNAAIPNLPLRALQLASLSLLGVSVFSIKLPAILLSVVAAVAIFLLLRRWFKSNVVILSMLIMFTTGQFIFLAQHATAHILYVVYSALILLFASLILQGAKRQLLWKIGLAVTVGLSCYTPYFIYINLGLLVAALLHPHPRHHLFKRRQQSNWLIAGAVLAAVLAPLVYLCVKNPAFFTTILGHESLQLDILANLKVLIQSYFWIEPIMISGHITPIVDFSSVALIILGVLVMFRHRYTARAYVILAWLLTTLPILLLRPHLTTIAIVPLFILLTMGIETLLSEWYKLFPKNPYARGAGLVLIVGLISVMVLVGIDRFTNSYRHMPAAVHQFSKDLDLVKEQLERRPVHTQLIVSDEEKPLYDTLARFDRHEITVTTPGQETTSSNGIVTHAAREAVNRRGWELQGIITNDRLEDANRLYLYKIN